MIRGVLNVDKPAGISSYDVIRRLKPLIRTAAGQDRQPALGHAGTLDPIATGVLLVLVGEATKVSSLLMHQPKEYEARVRLGSSTDTDDTTGKVIDVLPVPETSADELRSALVRMTGTITQVPPAFSALKQEGQPLYRLARRGATVRPSPRKVIIHEMELLGWQSPELQFRCLVSHGTYIRSLARDLGKLLGTVATLAALRRTRSGRLSVAEATPLADFSADNISDKLIPITSTLAGLERLEVSDDTAGRLLKGQAVTATSAVPSPGPVLALTADGRFLALVRSEGSVLRTQRVVYAD